MGETLVALKARPHVNIDVDKGSAEDELSDGGHTPQEPVITDLQGIRVRIATTEEQREQAYRLRYQVYCVENDFEPASLHLDERETDAYDAQSVHGLVIYRDTDTVAGTARLILPPRKTGGLALPTPRNCAPCDLASHSHRIPADSTAELSRFAISKSERYRHMAPQGAGRDTETFGVSSRQLVSTISLGLMQAAIAMARTNGISHLYALMEPALLRMLRGLGIHFEKLGPAVDYHGQRQPCFCDLDQLLETTLIERPDIWTIVTNQGQLWPRPPAEIVELHQLPAERLAAPLDSHPR